MTNKEALELMTLNPSFKKYILNSIPQDLNKFEQGLYVYVKLCSVLNYDARFFAADQQGPMHEKQSNLNYLKTVGLENNEVVCYNFNLICIDLLRSIGIEANFMSGTNFDQANKKYGGHTDMYMSIPDVPQNELPYGLKIGERIVLYGFSDMTNFKIDKKLILKLLDNRFKVNMEERSKIFKSFEDAVAKIVDRVKIEDDLYHKQQNQEIYNQQKVQELEKEYKEFIYDEICFLTDREKIEIFLEQVGKIDLGDISSLKYANQLYSNIHESLDNAENYEFTIIKEKEAVDIYSMIGIVSFVGEESNFYLKITPPNKIEEIKHRELQDGFNKGQYDYIGAYFNANHIIPDIKSSYVEENTNLEVARMQINFHNKTGKWMDGPDFNIAQRLIEYCNYVDNIRDKSFISEGEVSPDNLTINNEDKENNQIIR